MYVDRITKCEYFDDGEYLKVCSNEYGIENLDKPFSQQTTRIKKEHILWLLNSIRRLTDDDLINGVKFSFIEESEFVYVSLQVNESWGHEGNDGMVIITACNEDEMGSINFVFHGENPRDPEESLYKFQEELEQFVPEEFKKDIIPQWK